MGQDEVIECLKKHNEPISRKQISDETGLSPTSVSHTINKLLKIQEIKCVEYDRIQSGKLLGMNRPFCRTRFYYL